MRSSPVLRWAAFEARTKPPVFLSACLEFFLPFLYWGREKEQKIKIFCFFLVRLSLSKIPQTDPGNSPDQVGRGPEQPELFEDVPTHCREVAPDDL